MAIPSTLVDRVKIFTTSSGTGPFTLGDAVPAFRGVEALTNGLIYSYAAENGSDFEVGQGQFVSDTNQLIRTVFESSLGAGAPVPFPANVAVNFTALASDLSGTGSAADAAASATAAALAAQSAQAASGVATDAAGEAAASAIVADNKAIAAAASALAASIDADAADASAIAAAAAADAAEAAAGLITMGPLDFVEGYDGVKWDTIWATDLTTEARLVSAITTGALSFFDLHPDAPAVADIRALIAADTDESIGYATETAEQAVTATIVNAENIAGFPLASYYVGLTTGSDEQQGISIAKPKASFSGLLSGLPYFGVREIQVPSGGSGGTNGSYWARMTSGSPFELPTFSYVVKAGSVVGSVQTENRLVRPGKFAIGAAAPAFAPVITTGTPPVFAVSNFGTCYQPEDVVALISQPGDGVWRETFLWPTRGMSITGVLKPTATRLPMISGSNVVPNADFSLSSHPNAGGVVYQFTLALDTVNGGRTHNQGQSFLIWNDNSPSDPAALDLQPFTYVTSVALCAATPGTFYYDPNDFGLQRAGPGPIYLHPFGSTNPQTDGKTYVAPKRYGTFDTGLIDDLKLGTLGGTAHVCMVGNNGLYAGKNALVRRQIVGFATSEHSFVIGSGLIEDCISFDGNAQTRIPLAGSDTSAVFYTTDAQGQSYEYRRFMAICPDRPGASKQSMMLAHQGSGTVYDHGAYNGCIGYRVSELTGVMQATTAEMRGCALLEGDRFGLFSARTSLAITHNMARYRGVTSGFALEFSGFPTPSAVTSFPVEHNVWVFPSTQTTGQLLNVLQAIENVKVRNNFLKFHSPTGSASLPTVMPASFEFKRNIIVCATANGGPWQRGLTAHPGNAARVDYNVYIKADGSNPLWWNRFDTGANVTTFAAWKALGFDLHSVELTQAQADTLFLNGYAGMMAGDYRLNPDCDLRWAGGDNTRIVDGPNAAGPQEYYDHNRRRVMAGQPRAFPTPPLTWAQCHQYGVNPPAWNFYP